MKQPRDGKLGSGGKEGCGHVTLCSTFLFPGGVLSYILCIFLPTDTHIRIAFAHVLLIVL